ncbi:cdc42 effector protein 3-like [Kryptolebias marmoratus]|uniref:Cdc42 effector protein 2-like n=1 Tax=Kryptolebias marmoratus TaxID=37003 RepID=A0A3Q2Z9F2_KRYMA|nr:cdc42 effector protein 3-like [Kryptolebias marmoratus]XP_017268380.1 cdc42 effector protein 3-like [Kryptolebias marmoratus]
MPLQTLHRKSSRWSSRNSKRQEVLSVNMISLPLDDFRHITHIGSNGHKDSFGDVSFLNLGHSLLEQSSTSEQNFALACSPPPKPPRLNLNEKEDSRSPDWSVDQKRKKCGSMPLLDSDNENDVEKKEGCQKGNSVAPSQTDRLGQDSVSSDICEESTESCHKTTEQKDEDSGFSFSLDLGPSILDDVLKVMEKQHS